MPCIQTTVNVKITPAQEEAVKCRLGQAITLLPGKSEQWLMLTFRGDARVYFQGNDAPAAYVEVALFGRAPDAAYEKLTAAVTTILEEELKIPASRIYVKYEETSHWGYQGANL
jgi:phenylpyruvate tautomerase PptA (4-oxalocrotonate tautomerase family)